ncbi:hypothetical protein POTOM_038778 [Populus tomentosa]|uniref:Uncharacterized protein n=1 Tax=Populus tomentosa TaxID=118781 RepID=A0A8X7YXW0_POPTO|nr:hypothetical protein POTOM_038778 [Populus tomentosa]
MPSFSKVFSAWHAHYAWWVGVGMQQGAVGTWSDSEAIKEALIISAANDCYVGWWLPVLLVALSVLFGKTAA